jgi:hypothetical protein
MGKGQKGLPSDGLITPGHRNTTLLGMGVNLTKFTANVEKLLWPSKQTNSDIIFLNQHHCGLSVRMSEASQPLAGG